MRKIIAETDLDFLQWALKAILAWKPEKPPPGLIQIHGKADKLVPARGQEIDYLLEGGHFVVWEKAEEIEEIIKRNL